MPNSSWRTTRKLKELGRLLFELSNEDRLRILRELEKNPMKLSRVSERFGFTVPETARNMSRLAEADLISKDSDGCFHLTPFGEQALRFLPGYEFITKHKKYLKTHTLSTLCPIYLADIGVLASSEFVDQFTFTLFNIENLIRESEEFVWVITDQIPASVLPIYMDTLKRGVECRKIMPRNASIPTAIFEMGNDPAFTTAAREQKLESRYLDEIDLVLGLSEKVALVMFPDLEGKFDYVSFRTEDAEALNWAKSLFLYYWNKAKR
jgi:predicted transcriptional regulator